MRVSPRPPWRMLLLALLLTGGCTTGPREPAADPPTTPAPTAPAGPAPAPQQPSGGPAGVKLSSLVRLPPGYSAGLVTSKGLTGQRRQNPDGFGSQVAVQVTGKAWVGKLPARVWIPGPDTLCQDCPDLRWFPDAGSQWVVNVHDTDAKLIDAWRVDGEQVQVPQDRQVPIADDVDGGDPQAVDVDALKARAGRP